MADPIEITERGLSETCLGQVLQIKVFRRDGTVYIPLSWLDVWRAFSAKYPGRWAVQVFPPEANLVNGKAVYHLWVLPEGQKPQGLDLFSE